MAILRILNKDYMKSVIKFAREHKVWDCPGGLKPNLDQLREAYEGAEITIGKDHYPNCFSLYFKDTLFGSFQGGLIFHGVPGESYVENGSVCLTHTSVWAVHT